MERVFALIFVVLINLSGCLINSITSEENANDLVESQINIDKKVEVLVQEYETETCMDTSSVNKDLIDPEEDRANIEFSSDDIFSFTWENRTLDQTVRYSTEDNLVVLERGKKSIEREIILTKEDLERIKAEFVSMQLFDVDSSYLDYSYPTEPYDDYKSTFNISMDNETYEIIYYSWNVPPRFIDGQHYLECDIEEKNYDERLKLTSSIRSFEVFLSFFVVDELIFSEEFRVWSEELEKTNSDS